jgi:uncharacterized protein HemY
LGNVLLAQRQWFEAERQLRNSLQLSRQTQDEVMMGNTLGDLAEALAKQARTESALQTYDEAIDLLARHLDDAWARYLHNKLTGKRLALLEHQ